MTTKQIIRKSVSGDVNPFDAINYMLREHDLGIASSIDEIQEDPEEQVDSHRLYTNKSKGLDKRQTSSSSSSSEGKSDTSYEQKKFEKELLGAIRTSTFEYGYLSSADHFLNQALNDNKILARDWLNELYNRSYSDKEIALGILKILAHADYTKIKPNCETIAAAALIHTDIEIRECAVRCFENWGVKETLTILESVGVKEDWLRDYVSRVIQQLREVGDGTSCA